MDGVVSFLVVAHAVTCVLHSAILLGTTFGNSNCAGTEAAMNSNYKVCLIVAVILVCTNGSPIMVYSGTRMLPIKPPTPSPRYAVPFPPIPPAPVYEDSEPENSVYTFPFKFGYRLKPLLKSHQLPPNFNKYIY